MDSYSERLVDVLMEVLKSLTEIRGKSILLEPNLVDIVSGKEVTTRDGDSWCGRVFLATWSEPDFRGRRPRDTSEIQNLFSTSAEWARRCCRQEPDELVKVRLSPNLAGLVSVVS